MKIGEYGTEPATFAGGCFWCMVKPFDELPGIVSIVSGYTGGHTQHPTYKEVGTETTGHYEAVRIMYQPEVFPYERLLDIFWQQIDPTDDGGQFQDRGHSYRTAIFAHDERQRELAEASKRALQKSGRFKKPIVTAILDAGPFYPAEDEHQDYYKTHRGHYNKYVEASGRETFARRHWHTERDRERWKGQLTDRQFRVTQLGEDEPAFDNASWDDDRAGLYVDVLNGAALFGSADKFASGTGHPGFVRPIEEGAVRREAELGGGRARTLLRARLSNAYLGELLHDGPGSDKLHYRVNAAALRFVPAEELEREGYGRYAALIRP
ncbi:peptide methionine sulfoxide reductase msrA/msrB [Paenibacillus sp. UNC496MF]|uniref:peptide-methionine (S)-S-oxide reductase MsrA n=1 Tax=Paenibacillus sp. UNC496MF TaxID=1502753 RepID=UPI0008E02F47|nr:peptide-methionine (S)-S-oxide reductase MsrA [Paenibacillus sp. UNC496MF]SFI35979.1 peptide methionine sulfoxide reductase msrA/msrB [Paenibacillus sp. UNC496MF]